MQRADPEVARDTGLNHAPVRSAISWIGASLRSGAAKSSGIRPGSRCGPPRRVTALRSADVVESAGPCGFTSEKLVKFTFYVCASPKTTWPGSRPARSAHRSPARARPSRKSSIAVGPGATALTGDVAAAQLACEDERHGLDRPAASKATRNARSSGWTSAGAHRAAVAGWSQSRVSGPVRPRRTSARWVRAVHAVRPKSGEVHQFGGSAEAFGGSRSGENHADGRIRIPPRFRHRVPGVVRRKGGGARCGFFSSRALSTA